MASCKNQKHLRVTHLVDYLIGDGLFSKIPEVDTKFYLQAGICSSDLWPTKLRGSLVGKNVAVSPACTALSPNTKHDDNGSTEVAESVYNYNETSRLFFPRPNLPVPVLRQTYRLWKSTMDMCFRFRTLRQRKAMIVLQPVGDFPVFLTDFALERSSCETVSFFELLREFMAAFFVGSEVRLLPAVDHSCWQVARRLHKTTANIQLLAEDMNKALADNCLSSDAFAVVGISWTDLYPSEKQNFVLGQAAAQHRSAIVSFGRFEPAVTNLSDMKDITQVDNDLIWKMFKVVAHETCHLFYFEHCVFFDCLMNDSHSVSEAMRQPLHLCPICARKLHKVLRLQSISEHHRSVLRFLNTLVVSGENTIDYRVQEERQWLARCVETSQPQGSAVEPSLTDWLICL